MSRLHREYGDGLPGRVEVEGGRTLLGAADARLLVATERRLKLQARGRHVDVNEAGLRAGDELVGVAQGAGGYASGQAEADVVGELDGMVEVARLYDREDGAEDLLLRRLGSVVHVRNDNRGDVVALVLGAGGAAVQDHTPLPARRLKGFEDALVLALVHYGADEDLVEGIPNLHGLGGVL